MERIVECLPFAAEGHEFLLAIPSSAIFEVDPEVASWVRRARARAEAPPAIPPEVATPLRALGLLVADGAPTPALPDPVPLGAPLQTLVLHLTHRCGMRCDYCYAEPGGARGRGGAGGARPAEMTPERARAAVDFLFDQAAPEGPLGITFFGGEPLLNLAGLRAAADRARRRADAAGRPVRFSITTSAVPLPAGAVSLLAELGAEVTVSLDGPAAIHDAHRRLPGGEGSYRTTVDGLRRLAARLPVHGRATLTRRAPDPVPVVEHLLSLGMVSAGVSTADVPPGPLAFDDEAHEILGAGLEVLAARYLDALRAGGHLGFANLDGLLRTLHRGTHRALPCGAGVRLAACDTDGTLYLCHRLTGDPAHALGSLATGLSPDRPARLRAASLQRRPGCADCWARHLCGGGCHHARALAAAAGRERPDACRWLRRWFRTGLEVYGAVAVERPDVLDKWIDPLPPCGVE